MSIKVLYTCGVIIANNASLEYFYGQYSYAFDLQRTRPK